MNYFSNGFQNPYQQIQPVPMAQPSQQQAAQPAQVVNPLNPQYNNGGNFFYVNNKDEVDNWIVNQGQTVYLFDTTNSLFYIKGVGKNGSPLPLEVYEYHKHTEAPKEDEPAVEYVTKEEFLEMQAKLKAEIKKLKPLNKPRKEKIDD